MASFPRRIGGVPKRKDVYDTVTHRGGISQRSSAVLRGSEFDGGGSWSVGTEERDGFVDVVGDPLVVGCLPVEQVSVEDGCGEEQGSVFGVDVVSDLASVDGSLDDAAFDPGVVLRGCFLDLCDVGVDGGGGHELGHHGTPGCVSEGVAEFEHGGQHVVSQVAGIGDGPLDDLASEGVHEEFGLVVPVAVEGAAGDAGAVGDGFEGAALKS